jgi:predicted branched-subunit amino acid permease
VTRAPIVAGVLPILARATPAAAAIAVFGALYGAGARDVLGAPLTLASSLLVFSGALQFALVALVAAGAPPAALLAMAVALNLRHLVLGAVLRARLGGSRWRRARLAFFLLDETFGFAIAEGNAAEREGRPVAAAMARTVQVSGGLCYTAWQAGTLVGVLGAGVASMERVAAAIFPVLFIGLAALAASRPSHAVRAVAAAALTAAIAIGLPELRVIAPIAAGVVVALPGDRG